MSAAHSRALTVRHALIIAIVALIAALAISCTAPTDAHAIRDPTAVLSSHVGWVYVRTSGTAVCTLTYPQRCKSPGKYAWRWTGSQWSTAQVNSGSQVYAYPYSGAYHWVWTSRTGWLAMQTADLETGYRCTGVVCPRF